MTETVPSGANPEGEAPFSDPDHLRWNQKKQDMILNLGLASNSDSDQTPTPTRFIRNCEEVGLFQDLQSVNPFDEVFKKAVENPGGVSLSASASDETLHTPQIYPELEESPKLSGTSEEFSLAIPTMNNIDQSEERDVGDNPLIIALESEDENEGTRMREKLKATLFNKTKITPVPLNSLLEPKKRGPKSNNTDLANWQREANKAAQTRCRKKKQKEVEDMKMENKRLKQENSKLHSLNLNLQQMVKKLQDQLKGARSENCEAQGSVNERISSLSINQTSQAVLLVQANGGPYLQNVSNVVVPLGPQSSMLPLAKDSFKAILPK